MCQSAWVFSSSCPKCYSDVKCDKYRDCCPDVLLGQPRTTVNQHPDVYRCISLEPVPENELPLTVSALSFCPSDDGRTSGSQVERLRSKCDTANASVSKDAWEMLPVSSLDTGTVYRNIYCAQCNNDSYNISIWQVSITCFPTISDLLSLAGTKEDAILLLSTEEGQNKAKCTMDECHEQLCTEGKYLTSSGECRSLVSSNMLGYQVCLVFDVSTDQPLDVSDAEGLTMWTPIYTFKSILEHVLALDNWCPNNTRTSVHWQAKISREGFLEDLEQDLEKAILNYKQFIEGLLGRNLSHFSYRFLDACLSVFSIDHTCLADSKPFQPIIVLGLFPEKNVLDKVHFIYYSAVTNCSFLELPRSKFLDKLDDNLEFTPMKKDISSRKIYLVNETIVRLCVSDYRDLITADFNNTNTRDNQTLKLLHDISTTGGLISVICTGISLTCLLLTFITYLLLPTLRSASGKNLMVLILTLFLAQTFYQFTLEHSEDQTTCLVFGVLIHYTWMAALFSMNVCTIERFYMLCFPLTSRAFFLSKRPFILATAYTLLAPLAVCVVNMVANYVTSEQLGYGGDYVCFITSKISRIASFAVPVAIIVLVNISLMTFTACKLRRRGSSTQLQSSVQSKLGLVAMVRLSVVTGLMWLLAFLYDVSNNKYVDYVITALIGLHGVVLFYSLVINKRVAQLFLDMCRTKQTSSSRSKEESSTTQPIMGGRKHVHEPTLSASSGIPTISTDFNSGKISSITSESNM
ncbi:uncharacterized protein LOC131938399 [Physella acuta]|uniref:uncharacterized protein LOC131938399 n=1 Tax=Physella acuta TaxID=109671 RepID=UPI0027DDDB88|nr:uncharacterized protein LOC131938399 [Physella acuta]